MLIGEPGTAKSWLSEHLAAAISGDSLMLVQGTAGTTEEQIRYTWNYALLLAEGPSPRRSAPSPLYRAMEAGKLVRFEEITRCPSEVQDALITLLSEKVMAVPELGFHLPAQRGFNLIGTANTRDRGVNDMSAALKRRFNLVILPVPQDVDTKVRIVTKRVAEIGAGMKLPAPPPAEEAVRKIVQIFQELRRGQTLDGKQKIKPTTGVLSAAEAISLLGNSMALAGHFGSGKVTDRDLAAGLQGVIVKEDTRDAATWVEYLENVMKKRGAEWRELYNACKELTDSTDGKKEKMTMKAIKTIYQNGQITLSEPPPDADPEPVEVLVVFPQETEDSWEKILNNPTPPSSVGPDRSGGEGSDCARARPSHLI